MSHENLVSYAPREDYRQRRAIIQDYMRGSNYREFTSESSSDIFVSYCAQDSSP